jgi:hypothetical protein
MKRLMVNKMELTIAVVSCFLLFSCVSNVITGQTVKETREVSAFSGISLAFSGDVFVTQGAIQKVVIEAEKSTLEIIKTEINGNRLVLNTKDGHWRNLGEIKVYITVPEISSLTVSGSGDLICEGSINSRELELRVSGSGTIKMNRLEAQEVDAEITGSGDIFISGTGTNVHEMDAHITGSGNLETESLPVSEAVIHITGSGSALVNVIKELETNITGSGSVMYKGNPMVNANTTGSGKTKSMN